MGRLIKDRVEAEKYMSNNGWIKSGNLPFWKDPISNEIYWFDDAWDIQYERDRSADKTKHDGC